MPMKRCTFSSIAPHSGKRRGNAMIIGTPNKNMNELWYAQAIMKAGVQVPNSGIEAMLMKDDLQDQKTTRPSLWLESCKAHSHYNAALATRKEPRLFELFIKDRLRGVRPPDYLCLYLNTPQNRAALGLTGPDVVMTNEFNEVYPPAMRTLFGVICTTVRISGSGWGYSLARSGICFGREPECFSFRNVQRIRLGKQGAYICGP